MGCLWLAVIMIMYFNLETEFQMPGKAAQCKKMLTKQNNLHIVYKGMIKQFIKKIPNSITQPFPRTLNGHDYSFLYVLEFLMVQEGVWCPWSTLFYSSQSM